MTIRPIRVLSERIMTRGFEPTVQRLMENVQSVVRKQPGLISLETLSDVNDHHKYVVLSEWKSKKDYDAWVNSEEFKKCTTKINEVLDVPGKRTTIYQPPKEDIFLLTRAPANELRHSQIREQRRSKYREETLRMKGKIRVISERIMTRGYEPTVARLMETVKTKVRAQPGLLSVATYRQLDDQHKYVVFSEWRSTEDYERWCNSAEFKECSIKINEVLDVPTMKTRVFRTPIEDIFLL